MNETSMIMIFVIFFLIFVNSIEHFRTFASEEVILCTVWLLGKGSSVFYKSKTF